MFDFTDAARAVGEAFTSLFNYCKANKEHQSETQVVKDKRRLKKATNIAQKIFVIVDYYKDYFYKKDKREYEKLRKEFDELD